MMDKWILSALLVSLSFLTTTTYAQSQSIWEKASNPLLQLFVGKKTPSSYSPIKAQVRETYASPTGQAFCEIANNPNQLFQAKNSTLVQLVEWRTYMLNNQISAEACLNSCPNPTNAMKDFCHSLNWCRSNCTTSQVVKNCSRNQGASRDALCVANNCSPLPPPSEYYNPETFIKSEPNNFDVMNGSLTGVTQGSGRAPYVVAKRATNLKVSKEDLEVRKKIFLEISHKVIREFEDTRFTVLFSDDMPTENIAYYSELGKTYQSRFQDVKNYLTKNPNPKKNYLQHMPETMLCINLPTRAGGENHFLEVIEQNNECGNAFGIGQVISMTFYMNLGLNLTQQGFNTQNLDKKCRNSALQFLATECGSNVFQSQFFRAELFEKYYGLTIDQIYDRRSFDMELQIRLMYAAIINSFAMTQNWWGAFTSYRGNGTSYYANFTPGQDPCMVTHMTENYRPEGSM